jgi:hypothetical protein
MIGFQTFRTARIVLAGVEKMAMIKKGQSNFMPLFTKNSVETFYQLAS